MTNYVFVTGGVVSSLGKGIAASALGALLKARGFSVRIRKLDGYLNVDPGTMNPYQHGEVFVTEDGAETDLDLGHYERFTGSDHFQSDSTTMGRIYAQVIERERRGEYLGGTVMIVPHVIDEVKRFITFDADKVDFIIAEIGGTVGDIESLPLIEAARQLAFDLGKKHTLFMHLALVPYIESAGEVKTKAAQHSVKTLLSFGIQPDILLCRSGRELTPQIKEKLGFFCNVHSKNVISAKDVGSIYEVPLVYHEEELDEVVCAHFDLKDSHANLSPWINITHCLREAKDTVVIAIVGKYIELKDAYKSLNEALMHASIANRVKVKLEYIDATEFQETSSLLQDTLKHCDAILVPGGFGYRGTEGKIDAITFARAHKIPFLGICLGMQLAVIEAARTLAGIKDASSTEFGPTNSPVVSLITEWVHKEKIKDREGEMGGTMRLGAYPCKLVKGTLAFKIYQRPLISERHRHRYEVNTEYKAILEEKGMVFSGMSEDGVLPEIIEHSDHPFFIAVQFHPEFKSRPLMPHPLFVSFIEAAYKNKKGKTK